MKRKRIALAIIAIVLAMTSLFAFVACDDKDDNNMPLTFEEGTTAEDIIAMIDSGKIYSCTLRMTTTEDGDMGGNGSLGYEMFCKITPNLIEISLWYTNRANYEEPRYLAMGNILV